MKTYVCACMIVNRWILLRMGNDSDKRCGETQDTFYIQ